METTNTKAITNCVLGADCQLERAIDDQCWESYMESYMENRLKDGAMGQAEYDLHQKALAEREQGAREAGCDCLVKARAEASRSLTDAELEEFARWRAARASEPVSPEEEAFLSKFSLAS